jgi:hypothetical protein
MDVPHIHFDRLDEIYAMVKSNWNFEQFGLTSLTGVDQRSDRSGLLNRLLPITESDQLAFLYKPDQPLLTMII